MNPVIFSALGLVVAMAQSGPARQLDQHWIIRTDPVSVEAVLLEGHDPDFENLAEYSFDIIVNKGPCEADVGTTIMFVDDLPESIQTIRGTTAWIPPYLFVRSECGGGNAWACNREVVFEVRNGGLVPLGELAVGDDRAPALSLTDGAFIDIYDKLELATVLSHAESPFFRLVLRNHDGRLRVDARSTWLRNVAGYQNRLDQARSCSKSSSEDQLHEAMAGIFQCAALAKYCNRETELRQVLNLSEKLLSKTQREDLRKALALVVPLELPERWRK